MESLIKFYDSIRFRVKSRMAIYGTHRGLLKFVVLGIVAISSMLIFAPELFASGKAAKNVYHDFPVVGSRNMIWIFAQVHLLFGAFVLAVPVFAWIAQVIGVATKEEKYVALAREFVNLALIAFEMTALLGSALLVLLIALYPTVVSHLTDIFWPTYYVYVCLFGASMVSLYLYWSGFETMKDRKILHLFLGVLTNLVALAVMVVPNAWATFQVSPVVLPEGMGAFEKAWAAVNNFTWMPLNIHRFVSNVCLGGFLVGGYGAIRYLGSKTEEDKAFYDWMGYIGNFIGMFGFLTLPFAGYWLSREIYMFSQQMGILLMGGFLSWVFIIQAVLIGIIFLGCNYYFWLGLAYRTQGAEKYKKPMLFMLVTLLVCFVIWLTPHSLVASLEEARAMGGAHHPILGVLGVMSAKMTAVNLMILVSFVSFLMYWCAGKEATVGWAKLAKIFIGLLFVAAIIFVIVLGVWGYFVPAIVRINQFSVWQVLAVALALFITAPLVGSMFKGAKETSAINWGHMPERSQHALIANAVTIVFTMTLMGYCRSASKVHWHINGVLEDTSASAYSPALGYAGGMSALCAFIFFVLVVFLFWLVKHASRHPAFSTQYFFLAPFVLWAVEQVDEPAVEKKESGQYTYFLKAAATTVGLLLTFTWISFSVPQLENHPPKKVIFDPSMINTAKDLVREGKKLYFSKGKCSLCHSIEGSEADRCPKLGGIGARLTKEFLIESLVNPSKYIYRDYRGDITRSYPAEMPVIDKPPIDLTEQETLLVVAFLQSLGGEVTVDPEVVKALTPTTDEPVVETENMEAPAPVEAVVESVEGVEALAPTTVEPVVEPENVEAPAPATAEAVVETVEEDNSHAN